MNRWELTVDDDGVITLPEDLLAATGWQEGDTLKWTDNKDGTWTLTKLEVSEVDEILEDLDNKNQGC